MRNFPPSILMIIVFFSLTPSLSKEQNRARSTYISDNGDRPFTTDLSLNEINIHAFRHFRKNYASVSQENWIKTDLGYVVKFTVEGIRNEIHYKLNGAFQYGAKYYDGDHLQSDLKRQIERLFPDYIIGIVVEINNADYCVYSMKICNKRSIKTIEVCDGKIEIVSDLVNAG